ncbi:MotE family protein [Marivita sp. S2033]|uniref:MotE family protein n=1 Tax=Marivita sp. S2033 TaxID=3373187 RepID=UPI00398226E9
MKTDSHRKRPRKAKPAKGTLAIVGTLLVLSALLRISTEAGQVIASETAQQLPETTDVPANKDLARPEHLNVALAAIKEREARLVEREKEIAEREEAVNAAETAIEKELEKLEYAEQSLRKTISIASDAAENDVAQLTQVYSNMKPKQAAALFEQMDASFAAGFLARMPPDSAARVMAGLTPEKAYSVSVELAGRNTGIKLE